MKTRLERFTEKYVVDAKSGCWNWVAAQNGKGYGIFGYGGVGGKGYAHRWSYEHFRGPIPEGLHIDHLCRNPSCVNPAHLEPVTPRENLLRGNTLAALRTEASHCKHGHEFTPENTYVKPNGCRDCMECRRTRRRRSDAKEKRKRALAAH